MSEENLIRMANQIAAFFQPYPEEEAVAGVADHIARFWEPRMRAQFLALVDGGAEGLDLLALRAAESLRSSAG